MTVATRCSVLGVSVLQHVVFQTSGGAAVEVNPRLRRWRTTSSPIATTRMARPNAMRYGKGVPEKVEP